MKKSTQRIYNMMFKSENNRAGRKIALSLSGDLEDVRERLDSLTSEALNVEADLDETLSIIEQAASVLAQEVQSAQDMLDKIEETVDEGLKVQADFQSAAEELGIDYQDNPNWEAVSNAARQGENILAKLNDLLNRAEKFV
jgi:sensor domain CHASE-containing protein